MQLEEYIYFNSQGKPTPIMEHWTDKEGSHIRRVDTNQWLSFWLKEQLDADTPDNAFLWLTYVDGYP